MEDLDCRSCGKCNRKGKPSVMKHSKYCDTMRGSRAKIPGYSLFDRILNMMHKKGEMRRLGKPPKENDMNEDTIPIE
jgi:hypothetical protein